MVATATRPPFRNPIIAFVVLLCIVLAVLPHYFSAVVDADCGCHAMHDLNEEMNLLSMDESSEETELALDYADDEADMEVELTIPAGSFVHLSPEQQSAARELYAKTLSSTKHNSRNALPYVYQGQPGENLTFIELAKIAAEIISYSNAVYAQRNSIFSTAFNVNDSGDLVSSRTRLLNSLDLQRAMVIVKQHDTGRIYFIAGAVVERFTVSSPKSLDISVHTEMALAQGGFLSLKTIQRVIEQRNEAAEKDATLVREIYKTVQPVDEAKRTGQYTRIVYTYNAPCQHCSSLLLSEFAAPSEDNDRFAENVILFSSLGNIHPLKKTFTDYSKQMLEVWAKHAGLLKAAKLNVYQMKVQGKKQLALAGVIPFGGSRPQRRSSSPLPLPVTTPSRTTPRPSSSSVSSSSVSSSSVSSSSASSSSASSSSDSGWITVGKKSQQKSGGHNSQQKSGGHNSQQKSGGHNSQQKSGGHNSQQKSGGHNSQQKSGGHNSQQKSGGHNSQQKSGGHNSQQKSGGHNSQQKSGGKKSQQKSGGKNSQHRRQFFL